jgi:hypothetical protein
MGGFKKMWEQRWERLDSGRSRGGVSEQELADIAARLGGEVVDPNKSTVRLRVPRCGTVTVRVYSPTSFYVYDAPGSWHEARRYVCERLGLPPPPRATNEEDVNRVLGETSDTNKLLLQHYLQSRGITLLPDCLRFHPALWHSGSQSHWPAMVAVRKDVSGKIVALHRTYLAHDGSGKAPVQPQRMDLGPSKGSAIRLSPTTEEILLGEGIETVLSAMQLTGMPGWAAGSAMALRLLVLPPTVRRVIILVDGDDEGEHASQAAAARWFYEDREVKLARAGRDKDFNDLLLEESRK